MLKAANSPGDIEIAELAREPAAQKSLVFATSTHSASKVRFLWIKAMLAGPHVMGWV